MTHGGVYDGKACVAVAFTRDCCVKTSSFRDFTIPSLPFCFHFLEDSEKRKKENQKRVSAHVILCKVT